MTPETIETISPGQEDALIAYLKTFKHTHGGQLRAQRNLVAVLLMLDAGLRVGEVVHVTVGSVYMAPVVLTAIELKPEWTKTNMSRVIPLSNRLRAEILALLLLTPPPAWTNLFDQILYTRDPHVPMTTRQIERIVSAASRHAFGHQIHPHVLRHTFGTRLMRVAAMPVVQALLGHKHLSSTQVYLHPDSQDLARAIKLLAGPQQNLPAPHTSDKEIPGSAHPSEPVLDK